MSNSIPQAAQAKLDALIEQGKKGGDPISMDVATPESLEQSLEIPEGKVTAPPLMPEEGPQVQPTPQPSAEDEAFRQRYLSLKGKYDAEVPALSQKVTELMATVDSLQAKKDLPLTPIDDDDDDLEPLNGFKVDDDYIRSRVSEDLIEEFGLEYWRTTLQSQVDIARQFQPQVDTSRIKSLEAEVAKRAHSDFLKTLDGFVPNWRDINREPSWLSFLATVNPMTGTTYQAILNAAEADYDAHRVAAIFDAFKAQTGYKEEEVVPPLSLASQVMPSTPTAPSGDGAPQGKMSFAEWNQRLQTLTQGNKTPLEIQKEQQRLMEMYKDGKVQKADEHNTAPSAFV